jgi:para-nitrobenzyl esterase
VRNNIAEFGGDPNRVTLFGQSAGGSNALSMVVSPLAAGLFHRAIVQSGGLNITPMASAQNPASQGGHPNSSSAIVNQLLLKDGNFPDLESAGAGQAQMAPSELHDYLYSKSSDELYDLLGGSGFGLINVPTLLADGHVLPKESIETILSNADKHNSVPVILGSNRDEPSRFLANNPSYVETKGGEKRFVNEGGFLRAVKYGAMAWKERGVDSIANYLTASGNQNVYAYRFDWDEEGMDQGFDLSKATGAGHGLEIAFVFGDFSGGIALGPLYEASAQKNELAASMMSYWTEFAYSGNPGRGRDGEEVQWLPWGAEDKRSIILDTPSDQGIFMTSELVTKDSIKQAIANDPEIDGQRERCELYAQVFMGDEDMWSALEGCSMTGGN